MKTQLPLPEHQKLHVTYRIEPGCLGPEGSSHIDDFCIYVQKRVVDVDSDFIYWHIKPRNDKSLPEMEYAVAGKSLSHDKACQYLQVFGSNLEDFEDHIQGECVGLINQYFGR